MKTEMITGAIGTTFGIVGTATQTNEVLQTISLIVTIIGAIISMIVVPLISWYLKAKADGKITIDEIKDGAETLADGIEKTKEEINKETSKQDNTKSD